MKDEIQYRARCPSIWSFIFARTIETRKKEHVGLENLRQRDKLIIVYQPMRDWLILIQPNERGCDISTTKSGSPAAFFRAFHVDKKNVEHKLFRATTPATRAPRQPPAVDAVWCGGRL